MKYHLFFTFTFVILLLSSCDKQSSKEKDELSSESADTTKEDKTDYGNGSTRTSGNSGH
jgi:hypothetical protein